MTAILHSNKARRPAAEGYDVRIDTFYYRLAASPQYNLDFGSRDSLAERGDDRGSPQENVLDLGYAWARTDMSGGEGFDWDPPDIPVESAIRAQDPRRYFASSGFDVGRADAGNRYELTLSKRWDQWIAGFSTTSISASKDYVFLNNGTTVRWYSNFDDTVEEGSHTPNGSFAVTKVVATPDDRCLALLANGSIYKRDAGGSTFALLYDPAGTHGALQNIWFAKGRVIAWDSDGHLLEVPYDGSAVVEVESITSTLDVYSVVESGPCVVAAVSDGTLRTYSTVLSGGIPELVPAARNKVPTGEVPYLLGDNAGRLLFLTLEGSSVRLYQATVLDARYDYIVGEQQVRRTWNNTSETVTTQASMASTRDSIAFTVDESDGPAVWIYDLVTQGLSRLVQPWASSTSTRSVTVFDNRMAAVYDLDSSVWVESATNRVQSAWLVTPNITFGLNTVTNWIASVLEVSDLEITGNRVELWYSTFPEAITDWQSPLWRLHQRLSAPSQAGLESPWNGVESRSLALQIRAYGPGTDASPRITRTALRGFPQHRDRVVILPIDISDMVSVPGREPKHIPNYGYAIQERLNTLLGKTVELEMVRFNDVYKGIVNRVSEPITVISDRGAPTQRMLIEFRGTLDDLKFITGTGGVGIGNVAIAGTGTGVQNI